MKNEKYLTRLQERAYLIHPRTYVGLASRGEGKSSHIHAIRAKRIAETVPQSVNVWYGPTLIGLQLRMVSAIMDGWKSLGWIENRDWVKNVEPPAHWPRPHGFVPLTYKNTVSTRTGAIYVLGSNDRPGMVNSLSITGHVGIDEARFLNAERMQQDLFPAIRGRTTYWPNNPHVKSMTITSDMPFEDDDASWLDAYQLMVNKTQIALIALVSLAVEKVKMLLMDAKIELQKTESWSESEKIKERIGYIEQELGQKQSKLDKLRLGKPLPGGGYSGSTFVDGSSALGNMSVLGEDYVVNNANTFLAQGKPEIFKTSFLNIKSNEVANKFYARFKEKVHVIDGNWSYEIDEKGIGDWTVTSDLILDCNPNAPLEIEIDFGDMCSCSVSQLNGNTELYIASFEVYAPMDEADLIEKVSAFFVHHTNKSIRVYYDPSGNSMKNKIGSNTFGASVMQALRDNGWVPMLMTPDGTFNPSHNQKYMLVNKILKDNESLMPQVRIIRETNRALISSIKKAPRKVDYLSDNQKVIRKDKSSEKKTPLSNKAENTTDHSDHFDIKMWHKYKHLLPNNRNSFSDF